jgi:hypothetical protein
MDKCTPPVERLKGPSQRVDILMEIEYFDEHIVGKHVDCHQSYLERSAFVQAIVQMAYLDLVLDQTLAKNDRPS